MLGSTIVISVISVIAVIIYYMNEKGILKKIRINLLVFKEVETRKYYCIKYGIIISIIHIIVLNLMVYMPAIVNAWKNIVINMFK